MSIRRLAVASDPCVQRNTLYGNINAEYCSIEIEIEDKAAMTMLPSQRLFFSFSLANRQDAAK